MKKAEEKAALMEKMRQEKLKEEALEEAKKEIEEERL